MSRRSTSNEMTYTERRKIVAKRYLEGATQTELAKEFDVHQSTISRDLEVIRQQWVESTLISFNEAKARELAKIDRLEREYWEQYRLSKESKRPGTGKSGGDPRYLSGAQWCIEQRCKIFGFYSSKMLNIDMSKLSVAQLERISNGEDPIHVLLSDR